jgi:hypothetical protein
MRNLGLMLAMLMLSAWNNPARAQTATLGGATGSGYFIVGSPACLPGRYCASIETDIVQPPAVPNMGGLTKNGTVFYDTSYARGTASPVIRCSDTATAASGTYPYVSKSAGLGGSGDAAPLFNANDTLLHMNDNQGDNWIVPFNPASLACSPAITANLNQSSSGSSSSSFNFGSGYFDWTNTNIYHGAVNSTQVTPYTINPATGTFTVGVGGGTGVTGAPEADFQYGLPMGSLVSAWQASHSYTSGQYVTYTLTSAQAPDWAASKSTYNVGDIIQPLANNPDNCALKLVQSGTTGSTEPTWSSSGNPCHTAAWGTYADGTAAWQNLGGPAVFTFQLSSGGGTSGSSTPAFVPTATGHPDLMTTVSDGSLTWTNTGVMVTPGYRDLAGQSYNATRFCQATSTDVYGYNGSYSTDGSQGTGTWETCYSSTLNEYVTLNTATGWQSVTTCTGGTGYNCSGGSWVMNPVGAYTSLTTGGCGFFIHSTKGSYTMDYPVIDNQANLIGASGCETGNSVSWAPFASFNSSGANEYRAGLNHYAMQNTHLVDIGQACLDNSFGGSGCAIGNFGYVAGAYDAVFQAANPYTLADVTISWQPTPCSSTGYSAGVVYTIPPCTFGAAYDSHLSPAYNPSGADNAPVCGSIFNIQSVSPVPFAPWQGEMICVPTFPTWAYGASPSGQNAPWRFTHEFNSGSNSFFDVQFAISQCSEDGLFCAFSSDWMCTLGNTSGGSSSLCGAPWVGDTVYTAGQYVNPFSSTGGAGNSYGVFEITTGGTSAATHPTWFVCNSGTAGNTVIDANGVVYTCQGAGNGRGDVFIVKLAN